MSNNIFETNPNAMPGTPETPDPEAMKAAIETAEQIQHFEGKIERVFNGAGPGNNPLHNLMLGILSFAAEDVEIVSEPGQPDTEEE